MADCHNVFLKFHENITLTDSRKESLKNSKEALRKTIRNYFKKEKPNEVAPVFYTQGSFKMETNVNPIKRDDKLKYDLDEGVYFKDSEENRKSVETYHSWVVQAVDSHTKESVKDKNTCVRVTFADGHHIDLPIYFMDKNNSANIPQLAHKKNGWVGSDPKQFVEWFNKKKNQQIIRLIKYMKAWVDYKSNIGKFPGGFIFTILIVNNHDESKRDDESLLRTLERIYNSLKNNFVCYRPTPNTEENLLKKFDDIKQKFLDELKKTIEDGHHALENKVQRSACEKWQKHFGERFSCSDTSEDLEEAFIHKNPGLIRTSAKSA